MLTGRKLLLADDSAAIRKVIELTFSDEGMEVVTVADGRAAFEKMAHVEPDLVLADVYMPEVDGYELCRSIKQDARFAKTPVVLLISSFEPFDEAEARRAGADDVVTKPFQSIRQLVSRVGSLLSKHDQEAEMNHQYSTLGIAENEPLTTAPLEPVASEPQLSERSPSEPHVTVLVEAPIMEHMEAAEPAGVACSTDVELQTADTQKLEPIADESTAEMPSEELSLQDTIELEPVSAPANEAQFEFEPEIETIEAVSASAASPEVQVEALPIAQPQTRAEVKFDEGVLDLEEEYLGEPQMAGDDVFLDLDFEDVTSTQFNDEEPFTPVAVAAAPASPEPVIEETPTLAFPIEEPAAAASHFEEPVPATPAEPERAAPMAPETSMSAAPQEANNLSPAAIDAIARRVVEQLSDKVVREIAWEVVPELSELLIKQKLSEQK